MDTSTIIMIVVAQTTVLVVTYLLGRARGRDYRYHEGYHDGWSTCDRTWVSRVVDRAGDDIGPLPPEFHGINPNVIPTPIRDDIRRMNDL